ncbi:MAG: ferrous iron transport protein B [Desulfotomaculum sp.]|nr:ferrous iron transport protein B [Desulfotomaculum sp.]
MGHCHNIGMHIEVPQDGKKIVLVGNPNTGKSVFFNYLTGMYVDVSNYPGTTLEISHGRVGNDVIVDTPGVYGISSFNDEERVARDIILAADIVINVVNAVQLERDLFLTQQVIDTGVPVIVALNMIDEAERQGVEINVDLLSELLGVPVIPTVAIKKKGLDQVKNSINKARPGRMDPELKEKLNTMLNRVGSQGEALLILEGDPAVSERHGLEPENLREEIYKRRRERVNSTVRQVVKETNNGNNFADTLGRLMIRPATGIPILILALYVMYKVIGVFVAGTIVGITEETIMQGIYEPAVKDFVGKFIPEESVMGSILIGEFGLLTMPFTYSLGLLLPLVVGFYFFLSLFEDSGYLPRIATLVDRVLSGIGLNGRAIIPLILGFGCVTMATIVTRLLGSERERRIAIFLLGLTIPCSAQLGVILGLLAPLGWQYVLLYVITVSSVFVVVGAIMHSTLSGKSTDLLIDIPPLRLPRLDNVVKKTAVKSYRFISEAFPLFALGALIISTFQVTGILRILQNLLAPLTVGWLNLPAEASTAFIMGIVRRDFGAAGLAELPMGAAETVVALITITLFVPCIASIMVLFKERSISEAFMMWGGSWIIAFLVGGTAAHLLKVFDTASGAVQAAAAITAAAAVILVFSRVTARNKLKKSSAAVAND